MARNKEYPDNLLRQRLHNVHSTMMNKCYIPTTRSFNLFGGRGIRVCEDWFNFHNFYDWAIQNGYDKGMSLARINEGLDFTPNNCIFVESKTLCRNRMNWQPVTYENETKPIFVWAKQFGISRQTVYKRIESGWSIKKAITTPCRKYRDSYVSTENEVWQ